MKTSNLTLVREFKRKSNLRSRYRWWDNFKMDVKETVCVNIYWIHLALNKRVRNILTSQEAISYSKETLFHEVKEVL
jgi:hypothetical protein